MEKVWYWPGARPPPASAVQVTSETASVTVLPSSSVSGGLIAVGVLVAVQPGTGLMLTKANGVSVGSCTRTDVVFAVSLSLGTENVISPKPPGAAFGELTVTWADAVPTPRARTVPTTARTARAACRSRKFTKDAPRMPGGAACAGPVATMVVPEGRSVPPPARSPNGGGPGVRRCPGEGRESG